MNRDLFEQKRSRHLGQQQSTNQPAETQEIGEGQIEMHPPIHHVERIIATTREHLELR